MRRLVFLLGTIAAMLAPAAPADDSDPVFRSDVGLVRIDAQVLDRDNRAITGLRAEDFLLREQGKPQVIRNFASENMPLDVLLLFDVSASMRPHIQRIASAAHDAFRVLGPEDRVAVMVFDRNTRVRSSFRKNRTEVEHELDRMLQQESFRGGTDITRALYDAADYVRREGRRDARRAVVIVTDDQTEFNRDEAGVSRAFERADAVLSALIAPDMSNRGGNRYPRNGGGGPTMGGGGGLGGVIFGRRTPYPGGGGGRGPNSGGGRTESAGTSQIARDSGGDSMSVDDSYGLETTLQRLRQRYALYFYLPTGVRPGEERSITVDLADAANRRYSGAEVRYRRVYLSPGGASSDSPVMTRRQSAPGSNSDSSDGPPIQRRRPAVSDASNDGPRVSITGAPPPPAPATAASAPAPAAPPAPASAATPPPPAKPRPGWRRVTDSEDTNGPIVPADPKPAESSKPQKPDSE